MNGMEMDKKRDYWDDIVFGNLIETMIIGTSDIISNFPVHTQSLLFLLYK
jgi:hypothetical protein